MKKLLMLITAIAVMTGGTTLVAPVASATSSSESATSSKTSTAESQVKRSNKCKKTPKPYTKNGMTVLNTKTCFSVQILKELGCDTEAGKIEQPAPPRDPRSECKGKIKVHFKAALKTPKCPDGWIGGSAKLFVKFTQKVRAHALSISIANGRVNTWARTHIRLRDHVRGWVSNSCTKIPDEPTPSYSAPSISVNPGACVNEGQQTGVITVTVTNPNASASQADVTVGPQTKTVMVAANSSGTLSFSGYAPGTFNVTAKLLAFDKSATTTVTVNKCTSTPPTYQCPPGTTWQDKDGDGKQEEGECITPPPAVDHSPQISCVNPAHVYEGGDVYIYCEASDPDGDALSVNIVGDQYAHVSGVIPIGTRWDGSACPTGKSCFRATLWGDKVGTAHLVGTVTANGKSGTWSGDVPVEVDEF